jgi:hypothetical protein
VQVLVEELELVGEGPFSECGIGVEVEVRSWVDTQRAPGSSVGERPSGVDRRLPVVLGGADEQGCCRRAASSAGRYRIIWRSPRGATSFFHRVVASPPVNVWMW